MGGSVGEPLAFWTRAQKARVQITVATLSGNSLRQTVHTHRASVHQAAKTCSSPLKGCGVTAGLAESNGSLLPGLWLITCRLTAKNRDQLRNPTLGNRVWASFTFFYHIVDMCLLQCKTSTRCSVSALLTTPVLTAISASTATTTSAVTTVCLVTAPATSVRTFRTTAITQPVCGLLTYHCGFGVFR